MKLLVALLLAASGVATTGVALQRSNARIKAASRWSPSERLLALRMERALPAGLRKEATLSLRDDHAVLKIREPSGPVLLKCPEGVELSSAFVAYQTQGTPANCQAQAVDEVGDVLIYEVSGRVAPLCPGQYATVSEQQLHNALFLPALQLGAAEESAPSAVLQQGRLEQCTAGERNCAMSRAASAVIYCGVVRTCAEGACFQGQKDIAPDDVAASLYYYQALAQAKAPSAVAPAACGPVPMSIHLSTLISEAVTATSAAKFIEAQPWNASTLTGPGSAETAAELRGFFEKTPRGICLFVQGIDLDRPRDAEMAAQSLAFPVFAPFDPRSTSRATPLLRALQRATSDDELLGNLFARCDLQGDKPCKLKRDRIAAQLRGALGRLQPALGNLAADEIPYHVGSSGPFHLADSDALHLTLESSAQVSRTRGSRGPLLVGYQPLWPESVAEKRLACMQQPGICLFRSLWNVQGATAEPPGEDGFESMVALFARRDANTRCVRKLFNALSGAPEDRLLELQRELREPVNAGENRAPCDPRARAAAGLVPRNGEAQVCPETPPQLYGEPSDDGCRPVSLVYVQEEPWAGAAARIASIAAAARVQVSLSGIKASEVRRGSLGSWDVLLTVANNYYNRKYPTLVPLLHPAGNQNLSGGQAISEAQGRALLTSYESSIAWPPPAWLGPAGATPPTRAESLKLLEEDVARSGPAPIFPLAFLRPAALTIPDAHAAAARSPWYFARLVQTWSAQP